MWSRLIAFITYCCGQSTLNRYAKETSIDELRDEEKKSRLDAL